MTLSNFRFQTRGDTAANWTSVDPILAEREIGLETDTNKFKVGDGVSVWSALSYWNTGGGGSGDMVLADVQTVTGKKTFGSAGAVGKLAVAGTTSGSTIIDATAVAGSGTVTLPTTGTLATLAGTETLSNKTLVAPALGAATATTINKVALTAPATGSTLTIADGKTFTSSNTLTLAGTDGSTLNVGTGGTLGSLALLSAAPAGTLTGATLASGVTASSLTSVGTITTGIWNGTDIAVADGGTGVGSLTAYAPIFGGTTSTGAVQSGTVGSAGQVLTSNGAGALPTFQSPAGGGNVTGPGSSTDNAVVRFDGAGGTLIQNSAVTIADTTGDITAGKYNTVAISGSSTPTLAVTGTTSVSGTNTGDQNLFSTIAVSGQSDVVADTASDTLTLVAGSNVTITTNAGTDTITIAASGGGGNSFETIAVSGQSNVVADSSTDTLTLVAGTNVTITTDASTDSVTINSSQTNITGNAGTATALQTARTINGTSFDGTANITVTADAGTLTGSTLASGVTASSLTSVGTITSGTWNGTQMAVFYGGTGAGTFTDGGVLIGNGTSAIQSTSAGTAGQVLTSNGAGVDPTFQNATGGSGANPTASVGLTAVNGVASTFLRSDGAPALDVAIAPTWTGNHIYSKNGALSLPTVHATGTWITGGTATTTKPYVLIEPSGATSTAWSTNGTGLGVNAASGFTGNLIDAQTNGASRMVVSYLGALTVNGSLTAGSAQFHGWTSRSLMSSSSNGVILLSNQAVSDFTRLQFGGTTSSFPALARSGTSLVQQLADGTAGGGLTVSLPLAKVGGCIEEWYSTVGTPASTTETDLYSFTTVASTLGSVGDKLVFTVSGTTGANTTNSVEIKVYFGGTEIASSGSFTQGASSGTYDLRVTIIRTSSTNIRCGFLWVFSGGTPAAKCNYYDTGTFTFTSTNIIKITGKSTGASPSANDVQANLGALYWYPVG